MTPSALHLTDISMLCYDIVHCIEQVEGSFKEQRCGLDAPTCVTDVASNSNKHPLDFFLRGTSANEEDSHAARGPIPSHIKPPVASYELYSAMASRLPADEDSPTLKSSWSFQNGGVSNRKNKGLKESANSSNNSSSASLKY
jgi:hypothetical protein